MRSNLLVTPNLVTFAEKSLLKNFIFCAGPFTKHLLVKRRLEKDVNTFHYSLDSYLYFFLLCILLSQN